MPLLEVELLLVQFRAAIRAVHWEPLLIGRGDTEDCPDSMMAA